MKIFIIALLCMCLVGCQPHEKDGNYLELRPTEWNTDEMHQESETNEFSSNDAIELCVNNLGEVDEETGFDLTYSYVDSVYINGNPYYIIYRAWIVDNKSSKLSHPSFIGYAIVSTDGTRIYDGEIDENGNYSLGRMIWGEMAEKKIIVEKVDGCNTFEEKVALEGLNGYLRRLYGEYYNTDKNLELDIHGRVTFMNDKYVSYYFQGLGNVITAAHPNNLSYGVIINRANQKIIQVADIIGPGELVLEVNHGIIERFNITPEDDQILFTADDFENKENSFISSFISDGKIVVSVPVPHVIGDYALINIENVSKTNSIDLSNPEIDYKVEIIG